MKISFPHVLLWLGCCCALTRMLGCMPLSGTYPGAYPPQPIGSYNPHPYPGGVPWYPVGHPPYPGGPGIPIVMNPVPDPGTPSMPSPDPAKPPTIPVGLPTPAPTEPNDDSNTFWSPWPLPPKGNQLAVRTVGLSSATSDSTTRSRRSRANGLRGAAAGSPESYARRRTLSEAPGSAASEDLRYRGGRLIRDLRYVNLYVSGDTEWSAADVERIDRSLSSAMRDEHLNNVLLQYYDNQPISSTALPSHPLVGYTPKTVTRGDIQNYVTYLHRQGFLHSYDLRNTVFNFLLPPGTVLTVEAQAANPLREDSQSFAQAGMFETHDVVPVSEEGDSLSGMGGYHGSVVTANDDRICFTVSVYSERYSNGTTNGIPVFRDPWKNIVAALYHQLIETRTDPDVEDAIRESSDLNADSVLGWVSDSGYEIGDIPIHTDLPLTSVVKEVPLADGSGTVPVQLPYSNFVHGPEGPISQPHPLPPR